VETCGTLCEELDPCATGGGLGPDCKNNCLDTHFAKNGECIDLGVEMATCLKGARGFNADCTESFYRAAQAQCYDQVTAYQECMAAGGSRELPPLLCAQISGADSGTCVEDRKCLNSTWYNLKCVDAGDGQSNCTCKVHGDYIADITLQETVTDPPAEACTKHIAACLAASAPMP